MGQLLSAIRWRRSTRSLQELAARPAAIRDLNPNLSSKILISAISL
jgi:hypothetical protein